LHGKEKILHNRSRLINLERHVQAREFGHPYQEGGETDPGPGGSELCVGAAEVVKEEEGHKKRVNLLKRAFDLRVHF
jgi:hypothetical protein